MALECVPVADVPSKEIRTKDCKHCSSQFSYEAGVGKDRAHCSVSCRKAYQLSRRPPREQWPRCSTNGCTTPVRTFTGKLCNRHYTVQKNRNLGLCTVHKCHNVAVRVGPGLCEKHYGRVRRGVSMDDPPRLGRYTITAGYILLNQGDHPVANRQGNVLEHRAVLYDHLQGVAPSCFWCGKSLTWKATVVDHLNEHKGDNRIENLVPACNDCNRARGSLVPFIRRMKPESIPALIRTFDLMRSDT